MEENCGNCYFWLNGECRFAYPDPEHGWPKTNPADWCGDYDEAEDEPEQVAGQASGLDEGFLLVFVTANLAIGAFFVWLNWDIVLAVWERIR